MNKKWFIRASVVVAVCAASLLMAAPVLAPWGWCDVDPVLSVNGHTVNLDAAIMGDPAALGQGIVFHVNVPAGTAFSVVSCDPNASVKVNYNNGNGNQGIAVSVLFGTDQQFPAILTVLIDGQVANQVSGTTQDSLTCRFIA